MATFAVFGSQVEFFPLPLRKTIEDDQSTPIKSHKGFANAGVPWFCPSLLPPVAFMLWALLLITNSHLMAASQFASYRLNLCCSLEPRSSATGRDWMCTLLCLTFDTWRTPPWPAAVVKISLWLIYTFLSTRLSLAPPPPKVGKVWNTFSVCFF